MRDEPGKEQRYSFQSIHFILFKTQNFPTSNTIVVLISTHIDVVVNLKLFDAPSSIFSVTRCTVMFYYSISVSICVRQIKIVIIQLSLFCIFFPSICYYIIQGYLFSFSFTLEVGVGFPMCG